MAKFDDKAVNISVGKDLSGPGRFSVSFAPQTSTKPHVPGAGESGVPGAGENHHRVPRPARVVVQAGPPLWIATYIPPENSLPGFSRQDYEAEALVRVGKHLGSVA
jgi:hypothetical protein